MRGRRYKINPKISSQLFDVEKFVAHGYEVKIFHMKNNDLPDRVKITPTDLYHPELTYLQGDLSISYQGTFFVSDIDKMHDCLEDIKKLNNELKRWQKKNCLYSGDLSSQ